MAAIDRKAGDKSQEIRGHLAHLYNAAKKYGFGSDEYNALRVVVVATFQSSADLRGLVLWFDVCVHCALAQTHEFRRWFDNDRVELSLFDVFGNAREHLHRTTNGLERFNVTIKTRYKLKNKPFVEGLRGLRAILAAETDALRLVARGLNAGTRARASDAPSQHNAAVALLTPAAPIDYDSVCDDGDVTPVMRGGTRVDLIIQSPRATPISRRSTLDNRAPATRAEAQALTSSLSKRRYKRSTVKSLPLVALPSGLNFEALVNVLIAFVYQLESQCPVCENRFDFRSILLFNIADTDAGVERERVVPVRSTPSPGSRRQTVTSLTAFGRRYE